MIRCRHYMPFVLVALLAQASSAQDVEKLSNLRKGGENKATTLTSEETDMLPLGSPSLLRANDKPERFVVKCKEGLNEDECLSQIMASFPDDDAKVLHRLQKSNAYAISVKDLKPGTMEKMDLETEEDPIRVPLHIEESLQIHRELQQGQQVPYGIDLVNARDVWNQFGVRGENVKVCVLDTGLRSSHVDLDQSNLSGYNGPDAVTPWNSDASGHGTHVTGTIAASDNNVGVVGVSPNVEIFTVRVFGNNGAFFGSDIIAATEQCQIAGANIISMSLGGPRGFTAERQAMEDLYDDGIIPVAAAGNSGGNDFGYPASYETVVSVAAVNSNGNLASFSTRNSRVDVAAPGVNVGSTYSNGGYASLSGTSMATPHVSGVLALMMSYKPSATPDELIAALYETAENPETNGRNDRYGHGIVDALAAVQMLAAGGGGSNPTPAPTPSPVGGGNGNGNGNGNGSCQEISMRLRTDRFGRETSYALIDLNGNALWSGVRLASNQEFTESACVDPSLCYRFLIGDTYGDGINGDGLTLSYAGAIVYEGGDFGRGGYRDLGEGCA